MSADTKPLQEGLIYAFQHQVSSHIEGDAHSGDSADLASDVMGEMGLTLREQTIVEMLAEHVHGNYTYTGEAEELRLKIEAGEV